MEKNRAYYEKLILRFEDSRIREDELQELIHWYNSHPDETYHIPASVASNLKELKERGKHGLLIRIHEGKTIRLPSFFKQRWLIAAAVFAIVATVSWFFFLPQPSDSPATNETAIHIAPGSNKAILTLGNGRKVNLDKTKKDVILDLNGVTIQNTLKGELTYQKTPAPTPKQGGVTSDQVVYNTLQTPRGGQYQVVLPDGSKVWLNASTVLRYPQTFIGNERRVFVDGEAYFEIKEDRLHPFKVISKEQEIAVLGTSFNVNSYSDEAYTVTTLSSGAIQVSNGKQAENLRPGSQLFTNATGHFKVQEADMATTLAWKNQRMSFKNADIPAIMRQVSRWYNLDITYPKGIPQGQITGGISRQSDLNELLQILEFSNIHFRLEGTPEKRTLAVLP